MKVKAGTMATISNKITAATLALVLSLVAPVASAFAQSAGQKGLSVKRDPQKGISGVPGQVKELPSSQKRWALIIGVSRYEQETNFGYLPGPDRDARALRDALINYAGFPASQVVMMTSDATETKLRPTRDNIMDTLAEIATTRVDKDGLFLFAFSGHGLSTPDGEGVLGALDTKALASSTYLKSRGVPISDVQSIINESGVKQRIFLLDACRNNPLPGAKGTGEGAPMTKGFLLDSANRNVEAYVTLYATELGQVAWDNEQTRHGYFMEAIVEGLSGKAADPATGEVSLGRLINYVETVVKERTIRDRKPTVQKPFHRDDGHLSQDLVISVVAVAKREPTAEDEWDKIKDSATAAGFKDYERRFPNSKYAEEAAWRAIRGSKTWQDFKAYLSKYPRSVNADYARAYADHLLWEEVDRTRALAGYQDYLKEYPAGLHSAQAAAQIEEIFWQQAQQGRDYKSYLSKYPQGRYAQYAKSLAQPVVEKPATTTPTTTAPTPRVLTVYTNPPVPDARITIRPKAAGAKPIVGQIDATGAFNAELPAGLYDIEVTAAKYKSEKREAVRFEKNATLPIEMTPLVGSMVIGPVEADATVYFDNQKQSALRRNAKDKLIEIADIPAGRYHVRVEQNYTGNATQQTKMQVEREVEVLGGKQVSVFTEFKPPLPSYARLTVASVPDSDVYLDGMYKGRTDGNGQIAWDGVTAGQHVVEVKNPRFKPYKSDPFNVVAGESARREFLRLTPKVADSSPWYERFENTDNWDAARGWKLGWKGMKNLIVSGTDVGLANRSDYDNFELEFDVNITRGNRAAWIVRAVDARNYYLFTLEKTKDRARLYSQISQDGQLSRPRLLGDYSGDLPPQVHLLIAARGAEIKTFVDTAEGDKQLLGTFRDAQDYPIGRIGFRANADGDEFVIMDLQCRPKN